MRHVSTSVKMKDFALIVDVEDSIRSSSLGLLRSESASGAGSGIRSILVRPAATSQDVDWIGSFRNEDHSFKLDSPFIRFAPSV